MTHNRTTQKTTQISDTEHMTAYPEKSPTCNKSLPTLLYPSTPRDGWMGIELTFSDTDIVLTMFMLSLIAMIVCGRYECNKCVHGVYRLGC